MITYKPFIFGVDDDLIVQGVKIVWLDPAWKVQRKATVVERLDNEWCVRVSESDRELIINERRIVAIEEGALGNNRRENFVPEVPAKTDHLPPVVAAAVFTEEEKPMPEPAKITADQVIAAFVKTRDEISKLKKEFEEAEANLKALQERRAQWLLVELDKLGGGEKASIKTAHGTAFVEFKESATVADKEAFFGWVEEDFATRKHFLESRVSKTAVKQRLEDGETPPAGVNWVRIKDVKIRRA
jgi:hypothetical protein